MLHFDANREPVAPRDAATVIVLRPGRPDGVEVYCVKRSDKSAFMAGAVAFPGGKVDASDADEAWAPLVGALPERARRLADPARAATALAIAACRETFEEAGLLCVRRRGAGAARAAGASEDDVAAARAALASGKSLRQAVADAGLELALDGLVPFARWVTPAAEARRFDARFYLVRAPEAHEARVDGHEATDGFWARPSDVLARFEAGELWLAPPTSRKSSSVRDAVDVPSALEIGAAQSLLSVCPEVASDASGRVVLTLPGDPEHSLPEARVAGPSRFVLHDGRFRSAHYEAT